MNEELRRLVLERAGNRCESCHLPQAASSVPFEIDHIIAIKHRGRTVRGNLALSCFYCNSAKGPNIASIDRVTRRLVRLFHPRRHRWSYHFRWEEAYLCGRTPIGRVTVQVLSINDPLEVALRESLMEEGVSFE